MTTINERELETIAGGGDLSVHLQQNGGPTTELSPNPSLPDDPPSDGTNPPSGGGGTPLETDAPRQGVL